MYKAAYFFCINPDKDHVAPGVMDICNEIYDLKETDITVDGMKVLEYVDPKGNLIHFVRTNAIICVEFDYYLPILNELFSDYDFSGTINWHEGPHSPDKVLTVHTLGDVETGNYGNSNPKWFKNLICAIEDARYELKLDDFATMTEATHWSGVRYGAKPEDLLKFPVPMVDIEVGSIPESFANPTAQRALAMGLVHTFDNDEDLKVLLGVGGVHFEANFSDVILNREYPISMGHIIPNQWLVSGGYDDEVSGNQKMDNAVASIIGGIDGIVFHDKLKGTYKDRCRQLGERESIPAFKHKILKDIGGLPIW